MRVYKFLPLEFAVADVALRRLKVARLADLDDPFEEGLVEEGRLWFRPFDERLVLRTFRLGARCTLSLDQARKLAEVVDRSVAVTRTHLARRTFRIVDDAKARIAAE